MFDRRDREEAGVGAYVIIRDTTCRLFGYHGLLGSSSDGVNGGGPASGAFSLDHMFGF